eukprot:m.178414 g.178414  ORF g.178414 m.178414 type:complete len:243 (+) comp14925_c0_seq9:710-1438(+)
MGCGSSVSKSQAVVPYTRPPLRETTIITTSDLLNHAAEHNLSLEEVNILWLRFKLLGPTSSGLITARAFDTNIGTGFRHNAVLSKFVKTKYLDDDTLDFESFIRLLKWWKLSDTPGKLGCIFDLYDHDEDRILTSEETTELLEALCHGDTDNAALCATLQRLITERDDDSGETICKKPVFVQALEEFRELHRDILSLADHRVFDSKVLCASLKGVNEADRVGTQGEQRNTGIMRQKTTSSST